MQKYRFLVNTEKYKNKVTNKAEAIKLLSFSSAFWETLSEELKSDPEVIMYYQPMGIKIKYFCNPDYPHNLVASIAYHETGFFPFRPDDRGYHCRLLPCIEFPRNFNYDMYLQIQDRLLENVVENEINEAFGFFNEPFDFEEIKEPHTLVLESCDIFDRSKLPSIVAETKASFGSEQLTKEKKH